MSSVLLAGYFGFGNLGDEAILEGLISALRAANEDLRIIVASGRPSNTTENHDVDEAVRWNDVEALIRAADESDLILLGGGGFLNDHWESASSLILTSRHYGTAYYSGFGALGQLADTPLVIFSVGLGPLNGNRAIDQIKSLLTQAHAVYLRDRRSLQIAETLISGNASSPQIHLTGDPSFCINAEWDHGKELIIEAGLDPRQEVVAVCLRDLAQDSLRSECLDELTGALNEVLKRSNLQLLFLPFDGQTGDDLQDDGAISRLVIEGLSQSRRVAILENLKPAQAISVISSSSKVITMRYHAVLFAFRCGIPVIGLSQDMKISSLMMDVGLSQFCVTLDRFHGGDLISAFEAPYSSRDLESAKDFCVRQEKQVSEDIAEIINRKWQPQSSSSAQSNELRQFTRNKVRQASNLLERASDLELQRDRALEEKNRLERELLELRETIGVRLLSAYWNVARRLIPEGTQVRAWYWKFRSKLRSLLGPSEHKPSAVPDLLDQPSLKRIKASGHKIPAAVSPDSRVELHRFLETCVMEGEERLFILVSTMDLIRSEGQRATNIAFEMAEQGYPVIFSPWRWGMTTWTNQDYLDMKILNFPVDMLLQSSGEALRPIPEMEQVIIFEFPHPEFVPLLAKANGAGLITVYDVIDNWEEFRNVGMADWYENQVERHFANSADLVVAVNENLRKLVLDMGRRECDLLPNGVDMSISNVTKTVECQKGDVTVGFFGYLSREWIDWELLRNAARMRPGWVFHFVGHGNVKMDSFMPSNVVFHGKYPQQKLSALASQWDVGIVPFTKGKLSEGADTIKVYEYLAMGLPVVMTGVYPPVGAKDLVRRASSVDEFVGQIEAASIEDPLVNERREFAQGNSWRDRVHHLNNLITIGAQRIGEKRTLANGAFDSS